MNKHTHVESRPWDESLCQFYISNMHKVHDICPLNKEMLSADEHPQLLCKGHKLIAIFCVSNGHNIHDSCQMRNVGASKCGALEMRLEY